MLFNAVLSGVVLVVDPSSSYITSVANAAEAVNVRLRTATPSNDSLVKRLNHSVLVRGVDIAGAVALAEPEDRLDDREFGSGCVEA